MRCNEAPVLIAVLGYQLHKELIFLQSAQAIAENTPLLDAEKGSPNRAKWTQNGVSKCAVNS
jgi:hypothetical protein